MEIDIIDFTPDRKGSRSGFVDFTVTYSPEKSETFRGVGFFEKDGKKWLSISAVEKGGKWYPKYERKPSLNTLFHQVIEALEADIRKRSIFTP